MSNSEHVTMTLSEQDWRNIVSVLKQASDIVFTDLREGNYSYNSANIIVCVERHAHNLLQLSEQINGQLLGQ